MTTAQVNYHQMREQARHNVAQERLTRYQADVQAETSRLAAESSLRGTVYSADKNAETQRYTSGVSADATKYAAEVKGNATKYASDQSASASRYSTDSTARNVDKQTASQRYASDQSASASRYATDTQASTAQAKLALEYQEMLTSNAIRSQQVKIEQLKALSQSALNEAQSSKLQAETRKVYTDIENSLEYLSLQARELGLKEEAAKYENALRRAKTEESKSSTFKNTADGLSKLYTMAESIVKLINAN